METEKQLTSSPELWGGIECTINRVKRRFVDQLKYSKHYRREEDIMSIGELGVKCLRYPVLWEKHEPVEGQEINWSWIEKRLEKIRTEGIKPIAGLVHHGSGPAYTNLLDQKFPEKLAAYASKVAKKFPWIEYYTPVNEPLTTARFSGLYGLWYPHTTNDASFAKMLLNELKGVVLSMAEIRKINPNAKLVQTEDLGKTFCSKSLKYQAIFENERRWLTFDILCGKVKPGHRMWAYFKRLGIPKEQLQFFIDNPCPPDVMGINYYVTSERYLDEEYHKYPSCTHGGNELQEYADVEAVRVRHAEPHGIGVLLQEAWDRFKLPIAITEAHLSCTREEQMRWFQEIWDTCTSLRTEKGIDIKAVTAWALLGSFGWNRLLTSRQMDYETGAFDIRCEQPRLTALGALIQKIGHGERFEHPVMDMKGWWHRDVRFFDQQDASKLFQNHADPYDGQPLLILGKTGTLGRAFARVCDLRNIKYQLLSRQDLDITNPEQIDRVIGGYMPWAVVNAAGYVKVDQAEDEIDLCYNQNARGPQYLAAACKKYGAKFLTFSSDLVFDGVKRSPYIESDQPEPINIYGWSKAHAEKGVMAVNEDALVIRTSAFFGPWDEYNFVAQLLKTLRGNKEFLAMEDSRVSPTYVPDLVNNSLDLLIDNESGIWHLSNQGNVSWWELAREVVRNADVDDKLIKPATAKSLNLRALRPAYSVLNTDRGLVMPTLENALDRYFKDVVALSSSVAV
jgi:dTDP-4-dehydrorhamnose reductase